MILFEFFVLICVLGIWWILEDRKRYKGYPPGPSRVPVLGNLLQLAILPPQPTLAFEELAKSFGDVMFLKIGKLEAVVFSSYETILEILNHDKAAAKAPELIPVIHERCQYKNIGLIWGNGKPWQSVRRFTIRTLRDYGFGKSASMEAVVHEELTKFITHFDEWTSKSPDNVIHMDGAAAFDLTIINTLWRLVTGINYPLDDPDINRLLRLSNEQAKSTSFAFDFSIAFPFIRDWFPTLSGKKEQLRTLEGLTEFARETIRSHRKAQAYKTDPQCFVDVFLAKIDESKNDILSDFNDDQLLLTLLDLFQAGAETSAKTLAFGVLYMVLHQEAQEKVQKEIDRVVPKGSPILLSMKKILPYSCAAILETLRYSSVVPFPPLRKAAEDFYYKGYFIKKDTALMPNCQAAHFKKSVWIDPLVYRPERFLNSSGKIDPKMEGLVIPFGGGARVCLGKNLAEANLFLYFTTILRQFKFLKAPATPEPSIEPVVGVTNCPRPFDVRVISRQE